MSECKQQSGSLSERCLSTTSVASAPEFERRRQFRHVYILCSTIKEKYVCVLRREEIEINNSRSSRFLRAIEHVQCFHDENFDIFRGAARVSQVDLVAIDRCSRLGLHFCFGFEQLFGRAAVVVVVFVRVVTKGDDFGEVLFTGDFTDCLERTARDEISHGFVVR